MSWSSWIPRIAGYALAPLTGGASVAIGEGIAQGIGNNEAIKKADAQQQAGTNAAMAQQQQASRASGDAYTQQRADTQNLFGQPYQTLGGLMGMNIAPIGAPMGNVPSTASPTGRMPGLVPNNGPVTVQPGNWTLPPGAPQPASAQTLAQLAQLASAGSKDKSKSSYAARRA